MAYYNKLPPKALTRGDHLRKDAREWVKDEGSEYRRGRGAASSSLRYFFGTNLRLISFARQ